MSVSPVEDVLIQLLLICLFFLGLAGVLTLLGWLMMPSIRRTPPTPLTHTTEASDDQ